LSSDNSRTRNVWRWFMKNPEIVKAMALAGLKPYRRLSVRPPRLARVHPRDRGVTFSPA